LGVFTCGISSLIGLVLGVKALNRTSRLDRCRADRDMAIVCIILCSIVTWMMLSGILIFFKPQIREFTEYLGGQ